MCTVYWYWLPTGRAWFSTDIWVVVPGMHETHLKLRFLSPTIGFKWQDNKNRHTQTSWQHDSIQDRFCFLNGCIVYVTVLYFDSFMLNISMLTIPDYMCCYILHVSSILFYHSPRSLLTTLSLFTQVLIHGLYRIRSTSSILLIFSRQIFILTMWETLWFFSLFYYVVISRTFGDIMYLNSSSWNNW